MDIETLMQTREFQIIIACPEEEMRAHGPIEQMIIRGCKRLNSEAQS